jgi:hypothetical protein
MQSILRILLVIFCFHPLISTAQLDLFANSGNYPGTNVRIAEMAYKPKVTGSFYLDKEWKTADIILSNEQVKLTNVPVRIDAKYNLIEIKHNDEVKVLYSYQAHSLMFHENGDIYLTNKSLKDCDIKGFSKVLFSGESSLVCNYYTKLKEATYNPALHIGEKDKQIVIVPVYHILLGNEACIKLEKSKKKFRKQFEEEEEVYNFIKKNKINPKKEKDLLKFMEFLDSKYPN